VFWWLRGVSGDLRLGRVFDQIGSVIRLLIGAAGRRKSAFQSAFVDITTAPVCDYASSPTGCKRVQPITVLSQTVAEDPRRLTRVGRMLSAHRTNLGLGLDVYHRSITLLWRCHNFRNGRLGLALM